MKINFDVKGIDDAIKAIDDIQYGLDPNIFNEWTLLVEKTAKEICNDPDCKRIRLYTSNSGFIYKFSDKEGIDCLLSAIKQHIESMPTVINKKFEYLIGELEHHKENFDKENTA